MAYFINPDGTITTVEADYDRNGNLKPKINCEVLNDQVIQYNTNIIPEEQKSKATKNANINKKSKVTRIIPPKRQQRFISIAEIELFFKDRIANNKRIDKDEYISITNALPKGLKEYFISRYQKYHGSIGVIADDDPRNRKTFKKPKNKKKHQKSIKPLMWLKIPQVVLPLVKVSH